MRSFRLALLLLLLLCLPADSGPGRRSQYWQPRPVVVTGGTISDDFNRSDEDPLSQGGNWTEIKDMRVVSNAAHSPQDFTNDPRGAAYTGVSAGSINQYCKFTITAANTAVAGGCIFRFTDASSGFYMLRLRDDSDAALWYYHSSTADTAGTLIDNQTVTFAFPATFGATIQGTGNGTIVKVWLNPSAAAPTDVNTWDGGAATQTLSADPATAKDTGNFIGIFGLGSGGDVDIDDFSGGGL